MRRSGHATELVGDVPGRQHLRRRGRRTASRSSGSHPRRRAETRRSTSRCHEPGRRAQPAARCMPSSSSVGVSPRPRRFRGTARTAGSGARREFVETTRSRSGSTASSQGRRSPRASAAAALGKIFVAACRRRGDHRASFRPRHVFPNSRAAKPRRPMPFASPWARAAQCRRSQRNSTSGPPAARSAGAQRAAPRRGVSVGRAACALATGRRSRRPRHGRSTRWIDTPAPAFSRPRLESPARRARPAGSTSRARDDLAAAAEEHGEQPC